MASKILQQRQHSGVMDGRSPEAMRSCTRQHERWDAGAVNRWRHGRASTARVSNADRRGNRIAGVSLLAPTRRRARYGGTFTLPHIDAYSIASYGHHVLGHIRKFTSNTVSSCAVITV